MDMCRCFSVFVSTNRCAVRKLVAIQLVNMCMCHTNGSKHFVLCDSTWFSYLFEMYSGAGDNVIPENAPDMGAYSWMWLFVRLPKNFYHIYHILYFKNFYINRWVRWHLRSRGINSLATHVRIKLTSNAELMRKKVERG